MTAMPNHQKRYV